MEVVSLKLGKYLVGSLPCMIVLPTHDGGDFSAADGAEMNECNYVAPASKKSITWAATAVGWCPDV